MKNNRNTLLLAAVAVLGIGALLASRDPNAAGKGGGLKPRDSLLAGLDLEKAALLRVATSNQTVEIRKDGDTWKAVSLFGFPANDETVAQQLIALASLTVGQVMPGGDKTPAEFGLDGAARKVEVLDASGKALGAISVGKPRVRGGAADSPFGGMPEGTYVRAAEGPVVLVDADLGGLSADPMRWVNANVFSLSSSDITRIATSSTNESSIVTLAAPGQYAMAGLAADEEVNTGRAGRLERALQYISVSGVVDPKTPADKTGLDKAALYVAETREGIRYTVSIGGAADNGRHATFAFAYEPPAAPTEEDARKALAAVPPAPGTNLVAVATNDTAKVAAKLEELKKAHADKVKASNDKLATLKKNEGWIFIIPTYTAEDMTPPRAELVQKKAPPAPPPATGETAPPGMPPGLMPPAAARPPSPVTVFSEPVVVTNTVKQAEAPKPETPVPAAGTNTVKQAEAPKPETPAPAPAAETPAAPAPVPAPAATTNSVDKAAAATPQP